MTKSITLTFAGFANDLGAHERITLEASLIWHTEYAKADKATRAARREEFILNFLIGYGLTQAKAEKVMGQSRDDRTTADRKVYDAARAKFTYHIVRPEKKSGGAAKTDPVAQALELVAAMTPAQKKRFLAAL
jgi:hypothetical protein